MLCSCLLVWSIAAAAQRPVEPDFSGEWVLANVASAPATAALKLTVRQPIVDKNVRGEEMKPYFAALIVQRHFSTGDVTDGYQIGVSGGTIPGVVGGATTPKPEPLSWILTSVKWRGNDLVITNGRYSGPAPESGPYTEHEEVWSLKDDVLSIAVSDRASGSRPVTHILNYTRVLR